MGRIDATNFSHAPDSSTDANTLREDESLGRRSPKTSHTSSYSLPKPVIGSAIARISHHLNLSPLVDNSPVNSNVKHNLLEIAESNENEAQNSISESRNYQKRHSLPTAVVPQQHSCGKRPRSQSHELTTNSENPGPSINITLKRGNGEKWVALQSTKSTIAMQPKSQFHQKKLINSNFDKQVPELEMENDFENASPTIVCKKKFESSLSPSLKSIVKKRGPCPTSYLDRGFSSLAKRPKLSHDFIGVQIQQNINIDVNNVEVRELLDFRQSSNDYSKEPLPKTFSILNSSAPLIIGNNSHNGNLFGSDGSSDGDDSEPPLAIVLPEDQSSSLGESDREIHIDVNSNIEKDVNTVDRSCESQLCSPEKKPSERKKEKIKVLFGGSDVESDEIDRLRKNRNIVSFESPKMAVNDKKTNSNNHSKLKSFLENNLVSVKESHVGRSQLNKPNDSSSSSTSKTNVPFLESKISADDKSRGNHKELGRVNESKAKCKNYSVKSKEIKERQLKVTKANVTNVSSKGAEVESRGKCVNNTNTDVNVNKANIELEKDKQGLILSGTDDALESQNKDESNTASNINEIEKIVESERNAQNHVLPVNSNSSKCSKNNSDTNSDFKTVEKSSDLQKDENSDVVLESSDKKESKVSSEVDGIDEKRIRMRMRMKREAEKDRKNKLLSVANDALDSSNKSESNANSSTESIEKSAELDKGENEALCVTDGALGSSDENESNINPNTASIEKSVELKKGEHEVLSSMGNILENSESSLNIKKCEIIPDPESVVINGAKEIPTNPTATIEDEQEDNCSDAVSPVSEEASGFSFLNPSINKDQMIPDNAGSDDQETDLVEGDLDIHSVLNVRRNSEFSDDDDYPDSEPEEDQSGFDHYRVNMGHRETDNLEHCPLIKNPDSQIEKLQNIDNSIVTAGTQEVAKSNNIHSLENLPSFYNECVTKVVSNRVEVNIMKNSSSNRDVYVPENNNDAHDKTTHDDNDGDDDIIFVEQISSNSKSCNKTDSEIKREKMIKSETIVNINLDDEESDNYDNVMVSKVGITNDHPEVEKCPTLSASSVEQSSAEDAVEQNSEEEAVERNNESESAEKSSESANTERKYAGESAEKDSGRETVQQNYDSESVVNDLGALIISLCEKPISSPIDDDPTPPTVSGTIPMSTEACNNEVPTALSVESAKTNRHGSSPAALADKTSNNQHTNAVNSSMFDDCAAASVSIEMENRQTPTNDQLSDHNDPGRSNNGTPVFTGRATPATSFTSSAPSTPMTPSAPWTPWYTGNVHDDLNNSRILEQFNLAREIVAPEQVKTETPAEDQINDEQQTLGETLNSLFDELTQQRASSSRVESPASIQSHASPVTLTVTTDQLTETAVSPIVIELPVPSTQQVGEGDDFLKNININVVNEYDDIHDAEISSPVNAVETPPAIVTTPIRSLLNNPPLNNQPLNNPLLNNPPVENPPLNNPLVKKPPVKNPLVTNPPLNSPLVKNPPRGFRLRDINTMLIKAPSALANKNTKPTGSLDTSVDARNNSSSSHLAASLNIQTPLTAPNPSVQNIFVPPSPILPILNIPQPLMPQPLDQLSNVVQSVPRLMQTPSYSAQQIFQPNVQYFTMGKISLNAPVSMGQSNQPILTNHPQFAQPMVSNNAVRQVRASDLYHDSITRTVYALELPKLQEIILPNPFKLDPKESQDVSFKKIREYKKLLLDRIESILKSLEKLTHRKGNSYMNALLNRTELKGGSWKFQGKIIAIMKCFAKFVEISADKNMSNMLQAIINSLSRTEAPRQGFSDLKEVVECWVKLRNANVVALFEENTDPLHLEFDPANRPCNGMNNKQKTEFERQMGFYWAIQQAHSLEISRRNGPPVQSHSPTMRAPNR